MRCSFLIDGKSEHLSIVFVDAEDVEFAIVENLGPQSEVKLELRKDQE